MGQENKIGCSSIIAILGCGGIILFLISLVFALISNLFSYILTPSDKTKNQPEIIQPIIQTKKIENEPEGFRGIKWGTKQSELKGMVFRSKDDYYTNWSKYIRKGDDKSIADIKL
jgi:hypothetical protein